MAMAMVLLMVMMVVALMIIFIQNPYATRLPAKDAAAAGDEGTGADDDDVAKDGIRSLS